jgi:4-aminobutyrate aminotransferase-like enzyme
MSNERLIERRRHALGPTYSHFYKEPLYLVRGEGVWLYDNEGRKYLDCYNNVPSVGHCHPHVIEMLTRQVATLNTHTRYLHHNVIEYGERLAATLPGDLSVCLFVCTGSHRKRRCYLHTRRLSRQYDPGQRAVARVSAQASTARVHR